MEPLSSLSLVSQLCSLLQNPDFPAQLTSAIQASKRNDLDLSKESSQQEETNSNLFLRIEASLFSGAPCVSQDSSWVLVGLTESV